MNVMCNQAFSKLITMGDMKTPDFDDLLAAFDIPDIDAKEAIQSGGGEEGEGAGGLRPGGCDETGEGAAQSALCADGGAVSVIVRHTRSIDAPFEHTLPTKEGPQLEHVTVQNGFAVGGSGGAGGNGGGNGGGAGSGGGGGGGAASASGLGLGFGNQEPTFKASGAPKGGSERYGSAQQKAEALRSEENEMKESSFCQFSPISSVEEGEIEDDDEEEEEEDSVKAVADPAPMQRRSSESCSFLVDRLLGLHSATDTYSGNLPAGVRRPSREEKFPQFSGASGGTDRGVAGRAKPDAKKEKRDARGFGEQSKGGAEGKQYRPGDAHKTTDVRHKHSEKAHKASDSTYKSEVAPKSTATPFKPPEGGQKPQPESEHKQEKEVKAVGGVRFPRADEAKPAVGGRAYKPADGTLKALDCSSKGTDVEHASWDGEFKEDDPEEMALEDSKKHLEGELKALDDLDEQMLLEESNKQFSEGKSEESPHSDEPPSDEEHKEKEDVAKKEPDTGAASDTGDEAKEPKNEEGKLGPALETSASRQLAKAAGGGTKLSSCIEAIAALNAKKAVAVETIPNETVTKETQESESAEPAGVAKEPLPSESPSLGDKPPQSPLEVVRKASVKMPDSPRSVSSETSSKGSPAPSSLSGCGGSPPAIPKVRIRTIKTSSGEITRMVTRVMPAVDAEGIARRTPDASPGGASSLNGASAPSPGGVPLGSPAGTSPQQAAAAPAKKAAQAALSAAAAIAAAAGSTAASAGALGSSVKANNPSQVINIKFGDNTTMKATVLSPTTGSTASVQAASHAILKAANVVKQQQQQQATGTMVVSAQTVVGTKILPKAVQLASLNLIPQTAALAPVGIAPTSATSAVTFVTQAITSVPAVVTSVAPSVSSVVLAKDTHVQTASHVGFGRPAGLQGQPLLRKVVAAAGQTGGAQSSVVEAFNRLLNGANPVPLYTPNLTPPATAGLAIPTSGYRCPECGDSFSLEASLFRHYARRSLRIEVTCNHCSRGLVFYNKCSLLSHARQHKERGVVMQCSHLVMRPLPLDQLSVPGPELTTVAPGSGPSSGLPDPPTGAAGAGGAANSQSQSALGGVISGSDGPSPSAALPLQEDPMRLTRYGSRCLECSRQFVDGPSLAKHFQQQDDAATQTCQVCQMLLPNKCSFAAHSRIHQHKSPYTCPECGAVCRSSHFQSHIKDICLHYTRKVGYRCVHCGLIFAELPALKSHIQSTHCEVFYKCPLCPMAFKSAPSTHSHAYTQHPGVKVGDSKIIYKCSMCDTVFTQQTLLCSHFDTHVAKQKVSVFKCPDCALLYAHKQLMLDHVKSSHGKLKSSEGPPNLPGVQAPTGPSQSSAKSNGASDQNAKPGRQAGVNGSSSRKRVPTSEKAGSGGTGGSSSRRPASGRRLRLKNSGWTCSECQEHFSEREVYVSHVKRVHGKPIKKYPCRQCDRSFSSSHSLRRHIRINHEGIRKVYTCWYCEDAKRTFTKRFMLENHIRLMHGIKDPDFSQMPGMSAGSDEAENTSPETGNKRRGSGDEGRVPEARAQAITRPIKRLRVGGAGGASGPEAGGPDRPYMCAKCEFTTEKREEFQRHIPQHRTDGIAWQCSECGLCFTSQPSLNRHLYIVHRMRASPIETDSSDRGGDGGDGAGAGGTGESLSGGAGGGSGGGGGGGVPENGADQPGGTQQPSHHHPAAEHGTGATGCTVCGKTFDSETALNTHLRTHGMAFIKAKRAGATDK
ncbi:zinc finger protein 532 isoform X3 [Lampetra fluviatilis]